MACKTPSKPLTCKHSGKRGREWDVKQRDQGVKGEEKSKIRQRHKAIKTEGEFSPLKFTEDGYLTRLPVLGRASTIPHARNKKGNPNRREKRKEMKREEKSSFEEGE